MMRVVSVDDSWITEIKKEAALVGGLFINL